MVFPSADRSFLAIVGELSADTRTASVLLAMLVRVSFAGRSGGKRTKEGGHNCYFGLLRLAERRRRGGAIVSRIVYLLFPLVVMQVGSIWFALVACVACLQLLLCCEKEEGLLESGRFTGPEAAAPALVTCLSALFCTPPCLLLHTSLALPANSCDPAALG